MSSNSNTKTGGKGGRRAVGKVVKEAPTIRWGQYHIRMAEYLHDNYEKYKMSIQSNQKIGFLRSMRDKLEILCDDIQLKNGFASFLKKYDDVKTKLNSSGFGVDPDLDSTLDLDHGWIKKQCPYFEILDEVMGTRPNVTPPFVTHSSGFGPIGEQFVDEEDILMDFETGLPSNLNTDSVITVDAETKDLMESQFDDEDVRTKLKSLSKMGVKKETKTAPRSALGAFAEIMSDKITKQAEVEKEKLSFEKEKFENDKIKGDQHMEIEMMKVDAKKEVYEMRLQHEKDVAAQERVDKREQREHELHTLREQHEFELKKLEMEIELAKLKRGM